MEFLNISKSLIHNLIVSSIKNFEKNEMLEMIKFTRDTVDSGMDLFTYMDDDQYTYSSIIVKSGEKKFKEFQNGITRKTIENEFIIFDSIHYFSTKLKSVSLCKIDYNYVEMDTEHITSYAHIKSVSPIAQFYGISTEDLTDII